MYKKSLFIKVSLSLFFMLTFNYLYSKEQREIKIAYYENYPPFSFKENGELKGIFIDISNYIFQNKMKFKLIQEGFPWERAQLLVKKGEFDSHFTVKTNKREEYLLFQNGNTLLTKVALVYSRNNKLKAEIEKINSIESLKKFELISYIGDGWFDTFFSVDKNFRLVKISSLYSVLAMINSERKDIHITANDLSIEYIMKKNHFNNISVKNISFLKPSEIEFKFCLQKNYPNPKELMARFEKELTIAKDTGVIDKIISQYR